MPEPSSFLTPLGSVVVLAPAALVLLLGVTSLFDRKLSERWTAWATYLATCLALLAAAGVFVLMLVTGTRHVVVSFGDWVHFGGSASHFHFSVKFVFDRLSVPFVALSLVLCGTIGAFADRYLHREEGYNRFFVLYSLFTFGMVVTSLAGTIETLFAGWELVGLSSALLVAYYHERPAPVKNGLRVWVVYRISDAALLLAAVVMHHLAGEGDFDRVLGERPWPDGSVAMAWLQILLVGGLLLIAAAGKSALVPFSGWLPRAMEGPTPSSAVFYGALSVHLGAYLLLRVSPMLDASVVLSAAVVVLGLSTAALAALCGRAQTDVKSVLSYASLTQVGLIVAEIGLGLRYVALVHLLGHACLRTLQFLRAPSVLRDRRSIENALGGRPEQPPQLPVSGAWRAWLYRFALERGYLDAILDRFLVRPFVLTFRWFDALERRATDALAGQSAPAPVPDQSKPEEVEQAA